MASFLSVISRSWSSYYAFYNCAFWSNSSHYISNFLNSTTCLYSATFALAFNRIDFEEETEVKSLTKDLISSGDKMGSSLKSARTLNLFSSYKAGTFPFVG
jgi:hypothetical protein